MAAVVSPPVCGASLQQPQESDTLLPPPGPTAPHRSEEAGWLLHVYVHRPSSGLDSGQTGMQGSGKRAPPSAHCSLGNRVPAVAALTVLRWSHIVVSHAEARSRNLI